MRIVIIADAYAPMRTSAAVQLRDLAHEFLRQGHTPTVMIPAAELEVPWVLDDDKGVEVLRLKAPRSKDVGYIRRTLAELLMPFAMLRNLRRSPLAHTVWDGVVWYSPTIFLGPIVSALKRAHNCKSYLILRDIFPEWAVDMGLLSRGLPYRFFKAVERYQYSVADTIGVQTPGNLTYLDRWVSNGQRKVEVLQNWLAEAPNVGCGIVVNDGPLAGRRVFVYAGNMGLAQGMDILLDLAARLQGRRDIGFLFVGRGSESARLRREASRRGMDNVVFHDEIAPTEIAGLYAQCHVGIVSLDKRHRTHNIPGKFLSYMNAGMPVLASVNAGNDLISLILDERVGQACSDYSALTLERLALQLVDHLETDSGISARCRALAQRLFSPAAVVGQITKALGAQANRPANNLLAPYVDAAPALKAFELRRDER